MSTGKEKHEEQTTWKTFYVYHNESTWYGWKRKIRTITLPTFIRDEQLREAILKSFKLPLSTEFGFLETEDFRTYRSVSIPTVLTLERKVCPVNLSCIRDGGCYDVYILS